MFIDRLLHYDIFGVFYKNTLIYLTTNQDREVVKQNIDDPLNVPRHLPKTKIPNQHTGAEIIGVHVGHYFWIFGGKSWHDHNVETIVHIKSSLWSLSRDVWINGPEIPESLIKDYPCATALNDTYAIIININSYEDITPALAYDFSKGGWHSMANPPIQIPDWRAPCTCATMVEKTYRQYVFQNPCNDKNIFLLDTLDSKSDQSRNN